ncbi:MAG: efflux transporter outer membrane subunit [Muribaculaceae bacterium]|nr:efflux transporter outer membrane subunit [Muribaculaceae bacterium]
MNFSYGKIAFIIFCLSVSFSQAVLAEEKDYLESPIPETWQIRQQYFQTLPCDDQWWNSFNDPVLSELINKAVKNNFNIASALKRIEMASKEIGMAKANYYPTISLSAGYTKEQESGKLYNYDSERIKSSYFSLGASMSWEIDVFGRVYSNVKEKKAAYNVARADYDAVMVSLCASVATAYMELRTYEEELRVAKQHIESQKEVCKITEARFNADLGNMLDVTQARVVLYETEATLPTLEANVNTMKNSLALLVGEYPGQIHELLDSNNTSLPVYQQTVDVGIPGELLRRRPDIVEAEMELAEYAAAVGVAKKDFLPTLSITGDIGTASHNGKNLFTKNSLEYSIAPQLSWTLFEGLSRNYALSESKLQLESAVDQYNLTVMTAVQEVDNALISYASLLNAIELQSRVVEESKKSMELSFELYRSGLTMFTNVVDGQISWLTNQNTLVEMQGEALSALVNIYKALGGGWQSFEHKN